jgi:L-ascorbate metabolism protein UlaG (beta-lactamase superfamily)
VSDNQPKADIICISHSHFDHYDENSIQKVSKDDSVIICPAKCEKIIEKWGAIGLNVGESINKKGIEILAFPAYNTRLLRKLFHPKRKGFLGYIVKIDEQIIYHAGDCGLISELKDLNDITIAFLPISGWFTMNIEEAVRAITMIKPKHIVPMHERGKSIKEFRKKVKEKAPNTNVILLNPGGSQTI